MINLVFKRSVMQAQTTYPAIVGRVLTKRRKELGLHQADVAEALDVQQSSWSKVERGNTAITVEQLAVVSEILRTTPGELLTWADDTQDHAISRGIEVVPHRVGPKDSGALALIGAAALGAIVGAALSGGSRDDDQDDEEP